MGRLIVFAIPVAVIVYAFIDVLMTRPHATRRGPKWVWALAVLLLPLVGAVLWFALGRPIRRRPGQAPRMQAPDDDPDFLRELDRRTHRPEEEEGGPHPTSSGS